MKHYFIINPSAGGGKFAKGLSEKINEVCKKHSINFEIYLTQKRGDATDFVKEVCDSIPADEKVNFFSCGGDGTNYEVISGAVGCDRAQVGFIPTGTGNDFIRCFTEKDNFRDIEAQINGHSEKIDIIKCNDRYMMNMMNTGFDCEVARKASTLKTKPLISSSMAYIMGVVTELVKKPTTGFKISLDGGEYIERSPLLLATFSNGRYCGGGFKSSPNARLRSGSIDVCFIKEIGRLKFLTLVGDYRSGAYLFKKKFKDIVEYVRAKTVSIDFGRERSICIDGEIFDVERLDMSILPSALNIILPRGSDFAEDEGETEAAPVLMEV